MAMSNDVIAFLRNNPVFENEINELFKCGLCKNIMIDCCTTSCSCDFCRECILKHFEEINSSVNCPNCKIKNIGTNIKNNEWINTKIATVHAKCPNNSCLNIDTITNMIEHIKQCEKGKLNCPFFTLGCVETVIKSTNGIKNHFDQNLIKHNKLLIDEVSKLDNDNNIVKDTINNLSNGQENIVNKINEIFLKLGELTNKNKELDNKVNCYERQIEKLQRNEIDLREKLENKRQISEERMYEVGNKVEHLNRITEVVRCEINKVDEDIKTQLHKVSVDLLSIKLDHKKDLTDISAETKKLEEEYEIMKTHIINIDKKINDERDNVTKEIERRCTDNNRRIIKLENNLNHENEDMLQEILLTNHFIWKLEEIEDKKKLFANQCTKIDSEIFCSHQFGYKIKLRIDGLSELGFYICFVIMQGEFDEILEWPCQRQIKLAIINQESRDDEMVEYFHITTTGDNKKHVYNRPTESETEGPGCLLFWDDFLFHFIIQNDVHNINNY